MSRHRIKPFFLNPSPPPLPPPLLAPLRVHQIWFNQACELRDGGDRYDGKGVLNAVKNVNDVLGPMVVGMDPTKQQDLDDVRFFVDGSDY